MLIEAKKKEEEFCAKQLTNSALNWLSVSLMAYKLFTYETVAQRLSTVFWVSAVYVLNLNSSKWNNNLIHTLLQKNTHRCLPSSV